MRLSLLLLAIMVAAGFSFSSSRAQTDEADLVLFGEVASGRINSTIPQQIFQFDALRCDFLSVQVRTTAGDLDPVVTITDDAGRAIYNADDSNGSTNVEVDTLRIPRSGRYSLAVSRFGHGLGSTTGTFELLIERIGNGSDYGCALRYGDTVLNAINSMEPEVFYSFRASQGDIVNIDMRRITGNLDPYLQVVDGLNTVLAINDEVIGSGTDAHIDSLVIPADGVYYIIATRYGQASGESAGNFALSIEEAENSGLGNSPLSALTIRYNESLEGDLSDDAFEKFYRFEARQNDIISVSMERIGGSVDSFLVIANSNLQELIVNDDTPDSQNSLIEDFLVPADGIYFIIATRYQREAGGTAGRFRVRLESAGNAFVDVPSDIRRIPYGTSVTGRVDDITPTLRYAFWGVEGDTITASMSQSDGDLDPFINIYAADGQTVLASDDDGAGRPNARIDRFTVPATGVYYLEATRYIGQDNPNTEGGFVLVLAQRFDNADDE